MRVRKIRDGGASEGEGAEQLLGEYCGDLVGQPVALQLEGRAITIKKNPGREFKNKGRFLLVGTMIDDACPGTKIGGQTPRLLDIGIDFTDDVASFGQPLRADLVQPLLENDKGEGKLPPRALSRSINRSNRRVSTVRGTMMVLKGTT